MDLSFFEKKRILITGHTGFKGTWLTKILLDLKAEVLGYALEPPTDPSLFERSGIARDPRLTSVTGDIRDLAHLQAVFHDFRPEIVIHLAAQPIVRTSYEAPVETYEINVLGTVNLLECVRRTPGIKSVLNVTTDKVYENFEWERAYREDDRLDGFDPYSNSKSCSELVTHSYVKSFLAPLGISVSTARAGNVIGGGDYAKDRLLPDCVRFAEKGEPIVLRNPLAVRPFQHVLEPLFAYLLIVQAQYLDPTLAGAYNVGPEEADAVNVEKLAGAFVKNWGGNAAYVVQPDGGPHEANYLKLDNTKIRQTLKWQPVWDIEEAVFRTVAFAKAEDPLTEMEKEIADYLNGVKRKDL